MESDSKSTLDIDPLPAQPYALAVPVWMES
jgi:hypothetical protein